MMFMNKNIAFGSKEEQPWAEYGLYDYPITYNEKLSAFRAIVKNNHLAGIVKGRRVVIPNEFVLKIADEAAKLVGLKPFEGVGRHDLYGQDQVRLHAIYSFDQTYEVSGDKLHLGVSVNNSIDGSMGPNCNIFSFRQACGNLVFAGFKGLTKLCPDCLRPLQHQQMSIKVKLGDNLAANMKTAFVSTMDKALELLELYNKMTKITLTDSVIGKLRRSWLSKKILPDYIQEDVDVSAISLWEAYNDITENIWHNEKSSMSTKQGQFKLLDAIVPQVMVKV